MSHFTTRRSFMQAVGAGAAALSLTGCSQSAKKPSQGPAEKPIQGFERMPGDADASTGWKPISDRSIRVGIAGYGYCGFGAAFDFQKHPNVEVVAVSDLFPDRCATLARKCGCEKTYPSCEEMVQDDRIEAVFIATDAPSHARLAIDALKHGKHVASAVPAVFGSLEDADRLLEAVKTSGRKYMMFETSYFHEDLYAARQLHKAGALGQIVYAEGEYFHYMPEPLGSYKEWRTGIPPQWYPTHSNAYYVGVHGGSFTEVCCMAMPSRNKWFQPENNSFKNAFATEVALFRTSEGGMARMAVSWDTPGHGGEMGRIRGTRGSVYLKYEGAVKEKDQPDLKRPPLPPGVAAGSHGGSHGYLMSEYVAAILEDRRPLVDVVQALNMTVGGIMAHKSAQKNGELMRIPQYKL